MGNAMHVVGRSVEGVNNPAVGRCPLARSLVFLAEHVMVRKGFEDGALDRLLGSLVRLRHQIAGTLFTHIETPLPALKYCRAGSGGPLANPCKFTVCAHWCRPGHRMGSLIIRFQSWCASR